MNISQEKIDNLNTVVKININPEDYQPRVEKAMKDHAKKAKLPGFRPGMVPVGHIKKMYGKSILVDEINNMLSDTLNKYLDEEKLEVLGQPLPKVDDKKNTTGILPINLSLTTKLVWHLSLISIFHRKINCHNT